MVEIEKPSGVKRILRWILPGLGGLVLLYVIMLVIWYFSFSAERVAEQLGKFTEEKLSAKLSVEKTSLDVFPTPSIHLEGVQLAPQQGLPLTAQEITIALEFLPALWGEAKPAAITITHAQMPIMEDAQGRLALGSFLPNYGSGRHLAYRGHLYIKQSALGFFPHDGIGHTTVESADFDGDVELGDNGDLQLEGGIKLKNITQSGGGTSKPRFEGLDLGFNGGIKLAGDGSGWKIADGRLGLGGAAMTITAEGKRTDAGSIQTSWHFAGDDIYLAELFATIPDSLLPVKTYLNLGGKIALDMESRADGAGTILNGYIEVRDGECSLKGEREGVSQINGRMLFNGSSVEFAGLHGITGGKDIALTGTLTNLTNPTWDINLKGRIPLGIMAKLCGMAPDWRISGMGSVDAHLTGSMSDPANLHLNGSLAPDSATLYTPYLGRPFTGISGEIKLYGGSLTAGLVAKLGDGNLTLSGSMDGWSYPKLDIRVGGDIVDLDKALEKAPKNGKPTIPSPREPTIKCEIELQRCKLFGIQAENLQMTSDYADGLLRIKRLTTGGYGGSMSLSGQVDLSGAVPSYTMRVDISDVDINRYLSSETDVKDCVLARLSAHLNLKASGTDAATVEKSLSANGTASLGNGRIKGLVPLVKLAEWSGLGVYRDLPVDSIRAEFSIADGKITLRNVQHAGRDVDMKLAGKVGLDMTVDLKVQNSFSLQYSQNIVGTGRPNKMVRNTRGIGILAFFATGESKDPDFRLDPKAMGQEVLEIDNADEKRTSIRGPKTPSINPAPPPGEGIPPRKWF